MTMFTEAEIKDLMQAAGFANGPGPYLAVGDIHNFERFANLVLTKLLDETVGDAPAVVKAKK